MRALLVLVMLTLACEEPEVPVGPPRCEPEHEHEVDRRLKLAFKALAQGDTERARSLFQEVLAEEPGHPEAQLGLRLLQGKHGIEPSPLPDAPDGSLRERQPVIEVAGQAVAIDTPIETTRWRFEELRALAPLRRARDGVGATYDYYRQRNLEGAAVAADDREGLARGIDLIVLHDTHTRTAREAVVELEGRGGSTHFIIDWDGTVYQVLDLVWEANHSQRAEIDARSVSIDLVNPVELGDKPGLPDDAEDRGEHRPLSDFVRVQAEEVQQWGYTDTQITALRKLVRALGQVLPKIPMRVLALPSGPPAGARFPRAIVDGPDELRGVIGHLHLSRRAMDPGAGFPWESFDQSLRTP